MPVLAKPPIRLGQALDAAAARLRAAGIEGARRDARLLLAAALEIEPAQVMAYPERELNAGQTARAEALIDRRLGREPVSRILGRREFWGLEFRISPDTLDPRPDSETLVAATLDRIGSRRAPIRILDLGTGSGCLLLALLSELPAAEGLGLDVSPGALNVARENAVQLGLNGRARFIEADWGDDDLAAGLGGPWQAIVSNPPYIIGSQIHELAPEVACFDPHLALDAGPDGLASHRSIIPVAARNLTPGGLFGLEIGAGQQGDIAPLLARAGFDPVEQVADLSGTLRCLMTRLPDAGLFSQTGDAGKK